MFCFCLFLDYDSTFELIRRKSIRLRRLGYVTSSNGGRMQATDFICWLIRSVSVSFDSLFSFGPSFWPELISRSCPLINDCPFVWAFRQQKVILLAKWTWTRQPALPASKLRIESLKSTVSTSSTKRTNRFVIHWHFEATRIFIGDKLLAPFIRFNLCFCLPNRLLNASKPFQMKPSYSFWTPKRMPITRNVKFWSADRRATWSTWKRRQLLVPQVNHPTRKTSLGPADHGWATQTHFHNTYTYCTEHASITTTTKNITNKKKRPAAIGWRWQIE